MMTVLTQALARELFDLNERNELVYRRRVGGRNNASRLPAGTLAGSQDKRSGNRQRRVKIANVEYRVGEIIHLWKHGEFPPWSRHSNPRKSTECPAPHDLGGPDARAGQADGAFGVPSAKFTIRQVRHGPSQAGPGERAAGGAVTGYTGRSHSFSQRKN
jgi:hypothetical protein